jgi:PAS domain-containing protein
MGTSDPPALRRGNEMSRLRKLGFAAGFAAAASLALAGAAWTQPLERGTFHEEFTDVDDAFCDIAGLTVQEDVVVDGRFLVNPHGPDGLVYFMDSLHISRTFTNLDNGNAITAVERTLFKDLRVTDNGDGTLTVLVLGTGNSTAYGQDGKAIARNPGQLRFEVLVDHAGTPDDPSDDEFLDFLGFVKESTGRTDDFCDAIIPELTG